jgi:ketosteroid isomerase-like protein/catechol 2,3-dioxygenase-like lactoylglutathione lyase family enzyme
MPEHAHVHQETQVAAARLRAALEAGDLDAFGALLDDNVRWGGQEDTPETCHTRAEVLNRLRQRREAGVEIQVLEVTPGHDGVVAGFHVKRPVRDGFAREHTVYQVLEVRDDRIVTITPYPSREEAAARAGAAGNPTSGLEAREVVPILNVSNLPASFEWFSKLGWAQHWAWGPSDPSPPTFGAVGSGEHEVFLCLDGQGGRGADGVWLAIVVGDVDAVYEVCAREGLEVLKPPQDESWGMREMLVRHPDGHVLRIGQPS